MIIKPSSLGDIVQALPALTALRKNFPDAKITWLVRPEFAPLLENHPHLDHIMLFDRRFLGKAWFYPPAFASLISLIRHLRHAGFDAVFDFQGLFRTAALALLSGCKKRFGMALAREFSVVFYTHKTPRDQDSIHVVDYYLKVVRAAGVSESPAEFVLPIDPSATESVKKLLAARDAKVDNYAVLICGATRAYKQWPIDRFAAIADKLTSQFSFSIVATGSAHESDLVTELKNLANVPVANLAGRTSLYELVALLKNAKAVISNDTGPGHIAAALGTPLVMVFGCSNPIRLFPYGRCHCLAAFEPFDRGLALNSRDPKHDIKAVSTDDVYQKVCEQLEPKPQTS
ncbi:MAG: glycosyltransferase family 9 protein [Planctomycetota bacterium]